MIPSAFEYHRPASLAEATQLLASHDEAKILAGGHSLLPIMKLRLATPSVVIDIGRLDELRGIQEADGAIVIGANATHYDCETSASRMWGCAPAESALHWRLICLSPVSEATYEHHDGRQWANA